MSDDSAAAGSTGGAAIPRLEEGLPLLPSRPTGPTARRRPMCRARRSTPFGSGSPAADRKTRFGTASPIFRNEKRALEVAQTEAELRNEFVEVAASCGKRIRPGGSPPPPPPSNTYLNHQAPWQSIGHVVLRAHDFHPKKCNRTAIRMQESEKDTCLEDFTTQTGRGKTATIHSLGGPGELLFDIPRRLSHPIHHQPTRDT